ncbi:MAG: hypothetical protein NVS3B20_06020 [Polyangiales bacterium]
MTPHYLRFVRAIALVSGAAMGGCGSVSSEALPLLADANSDAPQDVADDARPIDAPPLPDGAIDTLTDTPTDTLADTRSDAPTDTLPLDAHTDGVCRARASSSVPAGTSIPCGAANTCLVAMGNKLDCSSANPMALGGVACGAIYCGMGCSCKDAAASTCECGFFAVGPLAPPDLFFLG